MLHKHTSKYIIAWKCRALWGNAKVLCCHAIMSLLWGSAILLQCEAKAKHLCINNFYINPHRPAPTGKRTWGKITTWQRRPSGNTEHNTQAKKEQWLPSPVINDLQLQAQLRPQVDTWPSNSHTYITKHTHTHPTVWHNQLVVEEEAGTVDETTGL